MAKCVNPTKFDLTNSEIQRYIDPDDGCFFIGDYTIGKGWNYSENNSFNSFILNLKKPPNAPAAQLRHKQQAILNATRCLSSALNLAPFVTDFTLVPIPPSKAKNDPDFDDRLMQILLGLRKFNAKISISNLLYTPVTRQSLHTGGANRDPNDIMNSLAIENEDPPHPPPNNNILLFDDVVTSGATFVACKRKLLQAYPDLQIQGLFLARAISAEPNFDVI